MSEKEQFKLKTLHRRFIRGTIAGGCKILLWTIVCFAAVSLTTGICAGIKTSITQSALTSYTTTKSSERNDSASQLSAVVTAETLTTAICYVIYIVLVVREISGKVKFHEDLMDMEDKCLGIGGMASRSKTKKKKVTTLFGADDDEEESVNDNSDDYDEEDDL